MKGLNPGVSHFISRSSMIIRVNIVLKRTVLTDVSTTCALVIFRVKVSVIVNNSPIQDYVQPDDCTQPTYVMSY